MATAVLILLILGFVCFLVAAVIGYAGDSRIGRTNFIALGLAFWITTQIIAVIPGG